MSPTTAQGFRRSPAIAVLRAGGLGDVLLALPAVASIRAASPLSTIRAVGYREVWEVAGELVNEVVSIDGPSKRAFDGADFVITWSVRKPPVEDVPFLQVSPYPPPGIHASEWLLQSLPPHLRAEVPPVRLALSRSEAETAFDHLGRAGLDRSPVLLHPGAGATWKYWPAAHFASLAEKVQRLGYPVGIVEGPADEAAVRAVQLASPRPLPVLRGLRLRTLAACLSFASAYVGNDSGVTHLASLVGIPALALFGPTDPVNWRPAGAVVMRNCPRHTSVQGQVRVCSETSCLTSISVDAVFERLEGMLKTAPGSFTAASGRAENQPPARPDNNNRHFHRNLCAAE